MNSHERDIYIELYKRKEFSKIPIGASSLNGGYFYLTNKQIKALNLLFDESTLFVGYGGGARSGKTLLECFWITFNSLAYPDTGWFLSRKELKRLRLTVLRTLLKLFKFFGLEKDVDYKYNQIDSVIRFGNGSELFLIDADSSPSDPEHLWTGGYELTGGALDESNECMESVVLALNGRCGWRNNDKYNLPQTTLETFNPDKGHVNNRYWLPFRDNKEQSHIKFIRALPTDNPHPSVKKWVDNMIKTGDVRRIERLVEGNFDYDDDPSKLCNYDVICDIFTNTHVTSDISKKAISADLAMQGRDRFVASSWEGLVCTIDINKEKSTGREIELDLKELKTRKGVGNTQIVADSDGLGAYLESYINNIYQFHGGGRAYDNETYGNIKDECTFFLASLINNRLIRVICTKEEQELITQELSVCLQRDNVDVDKKKIIKKHKMKTLLGRSPDFLDNLIMRMVLLIKPTAKRRGVRIS